MSALSQPWKSLPQVQTEVDHAFAGSLSFVYTPVMPSFKGNPMPAAVGRGIVGKNPSFTIASSGSPPPVLFSNCDTYLPQGTQFTMLVQAYRTGPNTAGLIGNDLTANTGEFNIYLPYSVDSRIYFRWGGETNGTTSINVSGLTFSPNDWFAFTTGPRGMEVWQNGRKVGSNSSVPSRATATGKALYFAGAYNTITEGFAVSAMLAFSQQLPTGFLAQSDYWGIFAPMQRRMWVGTVAAGGASNAPRYFHRTQAGQA